MLVAGRMTTQDFITYVIAQVLGAIAGAVVGAVMWSFLLDNVDKAAGFVNVDLRISDRKVSRFTALVQHSSDIISVVDAQGAGASDRRQLQRLVGAECIVLSGRGAMDEDREPSFVEDVHSIIARHGIGAHTDPNSGGHDRQEGRDAMSELGVRRRAVCHGTAMTRHDGDVGVVDSHAVNQQGPPLERAMLLEQCDW